jgi:hypothetical protein
MADQVSVEISIEEKAALQALTRLSKGIEGVESTAKKSLDKTDVYFANLAATISANLVQGALGLASKGFAAFVSVMGDAIGEASTAEDSVNRLNNSLALTGQYSEESSKDLQDFEAEMQSLTKISGDTIMSMISLTLAMGANSEQSKQIVRAAADMSQALGIDFETAVRSLSGTLNGQIGLMGKQVGELKNLTEEQLRAGDAIDLVAKKFEGAASAATKTFSGAMVQTNNIIGDTKKQLGFIVTQSPVVIAGINAIGKVFANLGNVIGQNSDSIRSFAEEVLLKTLTIAVEVAIEGAVLLARAFNVIPNATDGIIIAIQATSEAFFNFSASIVEQTVKIQDFFGISSDGAKQLAQELRDLANEQAAIGEQAAIAIDERSASEQHLVETLRKVKTDSINIINEEVNAARIAKDNVKFVNQERIADEQNASRQMIEARKVAMAELQMLNAEADLMAEEKRIMTTEIDRQRSEEETARLQEIELQRLQIKYDAEEAKIQLMEDSAQRELELQKLKAKQQIELDKLEIKQAQDKARQKQAIEDSMITATQNFIQAGTMLTKKGSAENQALQYASAIINTYAAANKALASAPPPFNAVLAASTIAIGLANVAQIKRQSFATGGVVGGFSGATIGGDNTTANVRTGEMVLNAREQKQLFDIAAGNGQNNNGDMMNRLLAQPIIVQVNNREIARAVRDARLDGFLT